MDTLSRRTFLAGTAATVAGLSLPQSRRLLQSGPRRPNSTNTITIAFPLPSASATAQVELALKAFTKATGITVNPIPMTAVHQPNAWVAVFEELSTRIASGLPLDSAYIPTEGMLLFEKKGVLSPLNSFIKKDQSTVNSFLSDIDPALLAKFRSLDDIQGNSYFLPIGYNVTTIWYHRGLFKQFNVPEPTADWTWDQFEAAAQKISSPPNRYGFAIGTPTPNVFADIYSFVLTNGGYILNPAQTACVAGSPAAIEAAAFCRGMVQKKLVNEPGGAFNTFTEAWAGRLGMFCGNMYSNTGFPGSQSQINKTFGIVPMPRRVKTGTAIGVGGFPIFEHSVNKEAVWEFIKFTTSEHFQSALVVPFANDMPIRQSIATSKEFLAGFPPGTHYYSDLLPESTFICGVEDASAVENEIGEAWESIITGATSPSAGMKGMQASVNQLLAAKVA